MCGRIAQFKGVAEYLATLNSAQPVLTGFDDVPLAQYNVAPSTQVRILHPLKNGLVVASVKWGWQPFWSKGRMPPPINARVETVAKGKYFKDIWPFRALVMADGWYEWVRDPQDPKRKQPYFIRLRSGQPMFMAAVGRFPNIESDEKESHGFVILTADSEGGMIDVHDRRPIVLSPALAREWIGTATGLERAEQIALHEGSPVEDFEWFPVGKEVGNVRAQGPGLVEPLEAAGTTGNAQQSLDLQ